MLSKGKTVLQKEVKRSVSAGTGMVDEVWQLSKDSADTATANTQTFSKSRSCGSYDTRKVFHIYFCVRLVVREKGKSRINTVTEVLSMLFMQIGNGMFPFGRRSVTVLQLSFFGGIL